MSRGAFAKRRNSGKTWTAYWYVNGPDGKRVQRSKGGFPTKTKAQDHAGKQTTSVLDGTYSEPTDKAITVGAFLTDVWLPAVRTGSTRSGEPRRASTIASYEVAVDSWIKPYIGGERLLGLTARHVEGLLNDLRARGGKGGRPLGARSVQYAHGVLRQALDLGVKRGYVQRNVAALVDRPGATGKEMARWTADEAQRFLKAATDDRLTAAWALFLTRGPRRGEVAGLRWADVDLEAGLARIEHTRVSIGGRVEESTPKTARGRRTLHLDAGLVATLKAHRKRQLEERVAWGEAWTDSGYVFTREDGTPYHPEHFSDRFEQLCDEVKVRRIRLHDCRHTTATLLLADGVPVLVVSEMLGHSNPTVTLNVYGHLLPGMAEAAGERLSGRLLGEGPS